MSYPPLPQPQDLVKIRPVESGVPSPITRYVPISELPVSGGGVGAVTDGVHTVTNATTIDFTGGATVTNLGGGVAGVSISGGGGGGALAAGLGTYLDTISNPGTTIVGNTGTIAQPASTGTSSLGIDLLTGAVTNAGTAGSYPTSAGFTIANLGVTLTDPAGSGYSAPNNFIGGPVTNGTVTGSGATIHFAGAGLYADGHVGGESLRIIAGSVSGNNSSDVAGFLLIAAGGVTNAGTAGNLTVAGGSAPMGVGVAGNLVLAGGGGGTAGGFIELQNLPIADPGTVAAPAGIWADSGVLVQTGHTAGAGGGFAPAETFITSSQMLTPPVGATFVEGVVAGAGGGGADGAVLTLGTTATGGGGGGGAQFLRVARTAIANLPAAPWSVTIGAGGTPSTPNGVTGGNTTLSTFAEGRGAGGGGSPGVGGAGVWGGGGLLGKYNGFQGNYGGAGGGGTYSQTQAAIMNTNVPSGGGAGGGGGSNGVTFNSGGYGPINNFGAGYAAPGTTDGANASPPTTFRIAQGYGLGGAGGAASVLGKGGDGSNGQYGGGGGGGGAGLTIGNGGTGGSGYVRLVFS